MLKQPIYLPLLLVTLIALTTVHCQQAPGLWPLPQQYTFGDQILSLTPSNFQFVTTGFSNEVLERAFARYFQIIFAFGRNSNEDLKEKKVLVTRLEVKIRQSDVALKLGMDESYALSVDANGLSLLTAETIWGALRGLETFSQLVTYDETHGYQIQYAPWGITDFPRFPHRGLLIDTSRNYLSVSVILKTIDALSFTKMNVLHWHIVDSQSFPFESKSYPLLSQKGAYSPKELYTAQDIQSVVQYAYDRGVRIIPEFDGPGHAYAWGMGYPNITLCPDWRPWSSYCLQPPCGQLNPSLEETYNVMRGVLSDAAELFPDEFFHLGADEVNLACYEADENLRRWMAENGMESVHDVIQYYLTRVSQISVDIGKPIPIFWQEVFNDGFDVPRDSIIQVWLDKPTLRNIITAGYRAILSNYQAWYLDCGFGDWLTGGDRSWCDPQKGWKTMYENEPIPDGEGFDPNLVLGGESCIWGESNDDISIDFKVWPRTAAVGERLWSARNVSSATEAFPRIDAHRARLVQRGINAAILRPKWCSVDETRCPPS